jgi:hypothetical protein
MTFFHATEARCAVNLDNVTEIRRTTAGVTVFYCDDSDPTHLGGNDALTLWGMVTRPAPPPEMALQLAPWPVTSPIYDGPEYHTTEPTPLEALGEPPVYEADTTQVKP